MSAAGFPRDHERSPSIGQRNKDGPLSEVVVGACGIQDSPFCPERR
jgi:hypothetical protein